MLCAGVLCAGVLCTGVLCTGVLCMSTREDWDIGRVDWRGTEENSRLERAVGTFEHGHFIIGETPAPSSSFTDDPARPPEVLFGKNDRGFRQTSDCLLRSLK